MVGAPARVVVAIVVAIVVADALVVAAIDETRVVGGLAVVVAVAVTPQVPQGITRAVDAQVGRLW